MWPGLFQVRFIFVRVDRRFYVCFIGERPEEVRSYHLEGIGKDDVTEEVLVSLLKDVDKLNQSFFLGYFQVCILFLVSEVIGFVAHP